MFLNHHPNQLIAPPEKVVQKLIFENSDDFFNLFPMSEVYNAFRENRNYVHCLFSNQGTPFAFEYTDQTSLEIFKLFNFLFHHLPESVQQHIYKNHYREDSYFLDIANKFKVYMVNERDSTFKRMIDQCYTVTDSRLEMLHNSMKVISFAINDTNHYLHLMNSTLRVFIYRLDEFDEKYKNQLVTDMETILCNSYPNLSLAPYYLLNTEKFTHHFLEKVLISLFESDAYRLSVTFDSNLIFPSELIRRYNTLYGTDLPCHL